MSLIEEALALWLYQTDLDLPEERTALQRWSLDRGEQLRRAFSAAVESRPWYDVGERQAPSELQSGAAI